MNVLSVFDGMSCGQIALERAGIKVDKYYASEIDKYAIQVTQYHYPNTIQLGDVTKWKSWKLPKIDLLIGGSPCQGFSNAGKGLNFDDPRSKLFFTYVTILKDLKSKNPDLLFLLENVKMKQEWQDIISSELGVEPVLIDSALVSAQSRKRLYWANFPITIPEDRGIILADIIEYGEVDREKSYTVDANYFKGGNPRSYFVDGRRQLVFEHQSQKRAMVKVPIQIGNTYPSGGIDFAFGLEKGRRLSDGKSLSRNYREGLGKAPTLNSNSGGNLEPKIATDEYHYRKLTPVECERLQNMEDNWTSMVSNTQRYKMLGNGWTIDVIVGILKNSSL